MSFTKDERETILRYDFAEKMWHAWTNVESHMNKFKKQNWEQTDEWHEDGRVIAAEFKANKPFVTIGNTKRKKCSVVGKNREPAEDE